jgi:hypothetical protein
MLDPAADPHRGGAPPGRASDAGGVTDRHAANGPPSACRSSFEVLHHASGVRIGGTPPSEAGFALRTRDDSKSCLGRSTERCLRAQCQVLRARGLTGLGLVEGKGVLSQRTIRSNAIVKNTLWALCTAIPIQALR